MITGLTKKALMGLTVCFILFTIIQFCIFTFTKYNFPTTGSKVEWVIILFLILAAVLVILLLWAKILHISGLILSHKAITIITICIFTLAPRILWIIMVDVVPNSDFKTYHLVASALAEGKIELGHFIALFPHVIGYPFVLSFFYRLFGNHIIVGQAAGILFSCGTVIMVFLLGKTFINKKYALIASFIYMLWPSHIIYAALLSSEEVYTFLLLFYIYLFIKIVSMNKNIKKTLFSFFSLGILCAFVNSIRPFGILILIASAVYYFIFIKENARIKSQSVSKTIFFITLAAGFLISSALISNSISKKIGREIAGKSFGFSLYAGTNINSKGTWCKNDSMDLEYLIREKSYSAQDIQDIFTERAIARVKKNGINNIKLLYHKHSYMWIQDTDAVFYINRDLNPQKESLLYFPKYHNFLIKICNIYYYVILLLSLAGCIFIFKNRINTSILLPVLLLWGIIATHIFVEAAGRYHYPSIPIFSLLASYGLALKEGMDNRLP